MSHDLLKKQLLKQIDELDDNDPLLSNISLLINQQKNPSESQRSIFIDDVANKIKRNVNIIVPVVCDDIFEYVYDDGTTVSIKELVCQLLDVSGDIANTIRTNFYYGISLWEDKEKECFSNFLHGKIKSAVDNGKIRLNDSVKRFLINGKFPLIITTFGFPVIERDLELGEGASVWYNPNRRNDLPFESDNNARIVYHIFGGETNSTWAYNEQSLLRIVHSLHSEDYGAKNLYGILRKHGNEDARRLLVLGASMPNWLFRFFIYPMFGEELKNERGYWLSLDNIEKELDFFLSRNNYTGQTNLRFENRIDKVMEDAMSNDNHTVRQVVYKPNIFVSYKRECKDSPKATVIDRVVNILNRQGVVWRDTDNVASGGTPYWAHIKSFIRNCDIFVPIVTTRYIDEYVDAPDIAKLAEVMIESADNDNTNDSAEVEALKPVLREAYYAVAYRCICVPIVIYDEVEHLDAGRVEHIAKDAADTRNLPHCIFKDRTILVHDDRNPVMFNLPLIKK